MDQQEFLQFRIDSLTNQAKQVSRSIKREAEALNNEIERGERTLLGTAIMEHSARLQLILSERDALAEALGIMKS